MNGVNFVVVTGAANSALLFGTAVTNTPFLAAVQPTAALDMLNATPVNPALPAYNGICVDKVGVDLSLTGIPVAGASTPNPTAFGNYIGNFAKNGSILLGLNGTNAVTIDLTNTNSTANTISFAGDLTFANANVIVFNNMGNNAVTVAPGAANAANLPKFTGTTPTISVPAGSIMVVHQAGNGAAVTAAAKNILITPAASGNFAVAIGGS